MELDPFPMDLDPCSCFGGIAVEVTGKNLTQRASTDANDPSAKKRKLHYHSTGASLIHWVNLDCIGLSAACPVYLAIATAERSPGSAASCQRATSTRSRSVRSDGRDLKLKESTVRFARDRPQPSAMSFDDRAADR
jgi:hypothetical protein